VDPILPAYDDVAQVVRDHVRDQPVYCLYPDVYRRGASDFIAAFPGRVLYAVKANSHPAVLRALAGGGIQHFDCASLPEVELARRVSPDATCCFMTPVRLRGAARTAFREHGVRHFLIDHASGLAPLVDEIDASRAVIFARMAVHHESAMADLSVRFGAPPNDIPALLSAIRDAGAEPALAFNVGSNVASPEAYRHSIGVAKDVLLSLPFRVRLVDIGGGFPLRYPDYDVPPLAEFFAAIRDAAASLPLAHGGELFVEPGRALAAPGMSALVRVLLRKEDRLFLNDGMYGVFWELRFRGHERFPVRCWRGGERHAGEMSRFRLYGPTCDSSDALPGDVSLPADVGPGDILEFGNLGAYSLTGRTDFNGFLSDEVVVVRDGAPPTD